MTNPYTTLLFDLDGTITDSAPGIYNSFRYALRRMGKPEPTLEQLRPCVGPPLWDSFENRFGLHGALADEAVAQYRVYYEPKGIFENTVYPGVPEMVEALQKAGFRLAVASSKKEESVIRVIEHFGLAKYFDYMGGSDESVGRITKTAVLRYVLEALHAAPEETVLIGDREHDVFGAKDCGMACLGVLWGYGSREELTGAGAASLSETPEELTNMLLCRS